MAPKIVSSLFKTLTGFKFWLITLTICLLGVLSFALLQSAEPSKEVITSSNTVTITLPPTDNKPKMITSTQRATTIPLPDKLNKKSPIKVLPHEIVQSPQRTENVDPETPPQKRLVIIIEGLGLSHTTTEDAFSLPKEVSFGFSPYGSQLDKWYQKASLEQRDVILHLPMENRVDPQNDSGPLALSSKQSTNDVLLRVKQLQHFMPDIKAFYTDTDETLSDQASIMVPLFQYLKQQDIGMIYGRGVSGVKAKQWATQGPVAFLPVDLMIDEVPDPIEIKHRLSLVEQALNDKHQAVILAHPYPVTLNLLKTWIPMLKDRGIRLVPVSSLLATPSSKPSPTTTKASVSPTTHR